MPAITYTRHARERIEERRISQAEVEAVLDDPQIVYHDRKANPIYVRFLGSRRIKVGSRKAAILCM